MPPTKAEKRGLTLEKLASYDDVITDALVDKVHYYTARA
jgi:histone-lysine N-methyltransferase SUV420H